MWQKGDSAELCGTKCIKNGFSTENRPLFSEKRSTQACPRSKENIHMHICVLCTLHPDRLCEIFHLWGLNALYQYLIIKSIIKRKQKRSVGHDPQIGGPLKVLSNPILSPHLRPF